jgi:tRNA pseudouridine13 synthase
VIPKIDSAIGILLYSTAFPGCGGQIKAKPEYFLVSEVLSEKTRDSFSKQDGFSVYVLKKSGIDTTHALERIYRKFGVRLKALGLKDASAVTEQFVCSVGKDKTLQDYFDEKISIRKVGTVKKPLSAKDMVGNHFSIKVTDHSCILSDFSEHDKILNFYGYQRFGSKRPVTHLVGKALVQRRFDDAVQLLLSFTSEYDSKENTKIRTMMEDPHNYSEALKIIPHQMDLEATILKEMLEHNKPQKAFMRLPLSIRRLFVDAYQSYIFNLTLSRSYQYGEDLFFPKEGDVCYDKAAKLGKFEADPQQRLAIPMVGYSYFKKTRFDYHTSKILQEEGVSPKDFYFKEMQEISSEGGFRASSIMCSNFSVDGDTVAFTLQRGAFATIVMREILKPNSPLEAGF